MDALIARLRDVVICQAVPGTYIFTSGETTLNKDVDWQALADMQDEYGEDASYVVVGWHTYWRMCVVGMLGCGVRPFPKFTARRTGGKWK